VSPAAPLPSTPARDLFLVKKPDGVGGSVCEVVDRATSAVVGRASSRNTAAGGSEVLCLDFVASGTIVRFLNSRGTYAKDARPGSNDELSLPCGEGAFASDGSSCVTLDASPFAYAGAESTADPVAFEVRLCDLARWRAMSTDSPGQDACRVLVEIPRGLNRIGTGKGPKARTWDARYCAPDRVLLVAEGVLRLHEAPSGKLLAKRPAPRQTVVAGCDVLDPRRPDSFR